MSHKIASNDAITVKDDEVVLWIYLGGEYYLIQMPNTAKYEQVEV